MGYHTDFDGSFTVTPALSQAHADYLTAFAGTRRMARNANKTAEMPDALREEVGLPLGPQGAYFVGAVGGEGMDCAGQRRTSDITDYNRPPQGQPGLWCQWVPSQQGRDLIEWDGGEKFYNYVEWIEYLIEHFLNKWGYKLNGMVEWSGEEDDDRGRIVIDDNKVSTKMARVIWDD